jgi:FixJ family two-component response regulator
MTAPVPPARAKVQVVDDDTSFRRSIARLLTAVGYDVETFASADHYLADGDDEGCLLLDVHMPGRSGLDLVADLARRGRRPRVVFLTADDTPAVAERARMAGAVAFLNKPVPIDDLLRAIEQALVGSAPAIERLAD